MRWVAVFAGHRRSKTLAIKRKYISFSWKGRLIYSLLGLIWPFVDWFVEFCLGINRSLDKLLEEEKPDLLIFPSQGNDAISIDLLKNAKSRDIPTIILNYNWDNMASKGPMRLKPDLLCVWGEDMSALACQVHRLRPGQVKTIGAAHFEQYFDTEKMQKAAQRAKARHTDGIPRILFAGNSIGHPEAKYLIALEKAIETGLLPPIKIIFRPHPWRAPRPGEKDFHEYHFRHIEMDPQMATQFGKGMNATGRPTDRTFAPSIEYNLHLLHSVQGVITPLSTLALEAALVGVPVLAVNFFEDPCFRHALEQFEHLQRMRFQVPGVMICQEEGQLIQDTKQLLTLRKDPALPSRMREAVQPIIYSDPTTTYSERLAKVAAELLQEKVAPVEEASLAPSQANA